MASIDLLRASDGSGNAQIATVQSTRAPLASTIVVDTVAGINDTFIGSMGTPHTFTDPITSETITVISEATAVDFAGHVDGANLEIDDIAPGYTDLGSAIGDIIIIRPTTQWGDELADVLEVVHNDDGTLKDDAVTTDVIADDAVTTVKIDDDAVTAAKIDWAATGANGGIWWEELGRTTLGVAGDTISVTPIAGRKWLKVLIICLQTGGTIQVNIRFNGDSGNNYSYRSSTNGAADTSAVSQAQVNAFGADSTNHYYEVELTNLTAEEKLGLIRATSVSTAGAGTAPSHMEGAFKWANAAAQITRIDVLNGGTGDFDAGSEVVILGHN